MGQSMSTMYRTYYESPDTSPDVEGDPTYRHDYGFPGKRKKRSTYFRTNMASVNVSDFRTL